MLIDWRISAGTLMMSDVHSIEHYDCRNPETARRMQREISTRNVTKEYVCKVEGVFPEFDHILVAFYCSFKTYCVNKCMCVIVVSL